MSDDLLFVQTGFPSPDIQYGQRVFALKTASSIDEQTTPDCGFAGCLSGKKGHPTAAPSISIRHRLFGVLAALFLFFGGGRLAGA